MKRCRIYHIIDIFVGNEILMQPEFLHFFQNNSHIFGSLMNMHTGVFITAFNHISKYHHHGILHFGNSFLLFLNFSGILPAVFNHFEESFIEMLNFIAGMNTQLFEYFYVVINCRLAVEGKFTCSQCNWVNRINQGIINVADNREHNQNQESDEKEHQLYQINNLVFYNMIHSYIGSDIAYGTSILVLNRVVHGQKPSVPVVWNYRIYFLSRLQPVKNRKKGFIKRNNCARILSRLPFLIGIKNHQTSVINYFVDIQEFNMRSGISYQWQFSQNLCIFTIRFAFLHIGINFIRIQQFWWLKGYLVGYLGVFWNHVVVIQKWTQRGCNNWYKNDWSGNDNDYLGTNWVFAALYVFCHGGILPGERILLPERYYQFIMQGFGR